MNDFNILDYLISPFDFEAQQAIKEQERQERQERLEELELELDEDDYYQRAYSKFLQELLGN